MSDIQLHETNYPPGWDCKYDTKTGKWQVYTLFFSHLKLCR